MPDPTDAPMTNNNDQLVRFLLPEAGVRGVHVRLDASWQALLSHAQYPPVATELLGEALAASALLTGHIKVDGRLSLMLRSPGDLRTLFAECTSDGSVRGIVRLEEGRDAPRELSSLGDEAMLAMTIENPGLDPREPQRYQSFVNLDAASLEGALENYFRQSEQLPTRLLLSADGAQVSGLMLQKLPGDAGDQDGWNRACALFDTLGHAELASHDAATVLHRLFHEEGVELVGDKPLAFGCSCSRERVAGMLESLGEEEALAAAAANGDQVEVRCEFCARLYHFSLTDLNLMFTSSSVQAASPDLLH
jgi:molecular chaperone Hsp33